MKTTSPQPTTAPKTSRTVRVTMALDIQDRDGKAVFSTYEGEIGSCDRQAFLDTIAAEFGVVILPADPAERHVIEFRADGWTIQHTLACRTSGNLFACPVNRAAEATLTDPPAELGRFEVDHNNGHLVIGASVNTPKEG